MPTPLVAAIQRYIAPLAPQTLYATPSERVAILRATHETLPAHRLVRPSLCIVAQGSKWASVGGNQLVYGESQALVVGIEAPSLGRVSQASPEAPCLVLAVELDPALFTQMAESMAPPPVAASAGAKGVFVTDFQGPLMDCAVRLVRLLETPAAIPALYPLIMREIAYWLLSGPHGSEVAAMVLGNPLSRRVLQALQRLRERFAEPVRLGELAALAQLSVSAFSRQFKALTSFTPLQYQKHLRLLEARRLMVADGINAETAALRVGYESQSQFSREYARLFGVPPKRHSKQMLGVG